MARCMAAIASSMRPLRASTIARRYHHFASERLRATSPTAYASRAAPTMPFASQIIPNRPHRCGVARILRQAVECLAGRVRHFGRDRAEALYAAAAPATVMRRAAPETRRAPPRPRAPPRDDCQESLRRASTMKRRTGRWMTRSGTRMRSVARRLAARATLLGSGWLRTSGPETQLIPNPVTATVTTLPFELRADAREPRRDDRHRQQERRPGPPGDVRRGVRVREVEAVREHRDRPAAADLDHLLHARVEQDDVVLPPRADRLGQDALRAVVDASPESSGRTADPPACAAPA